MTRTCIRLTLLLITACGSGCFVTRADEDAQSTPNVGLPDQTTKGCDACGTDMPQPPKPLADLSTTDADPPRDLLGVELPQADIPPIDANGDSVKDDAAPGDLKEIVPKDIPWVDNDVVPPIDLSKPEDVPLVEPDVPIVDPDVPVVEPDVPPLAGVVYYVRPDGGDTTQCTGLVDAPYSGTGTNQPCAFSHPGWVLPVGGTPLLKGGETLVIGPGSYRIGWPVIGPNNKASCTAQAAYLCTLPAIPSGPSADKPTRILGKGWDTGCKNPPELFGVEKLAQVLNLSGSNHIELRCLEITDHSPCIEFHNGGNSCNRDKAPYGPWAQRGIYATDSKNVLLKHVNIHGFANAGIQAGRLQDWTLEDVRIAFNGWAGWNGELDGEPQNSGNSGVMRFTRAVFEWNGCGETADGKPIGCWSAYGDGLGTAKTGGTWIFNDSKFLHNTSDGLDLLYRTGPGEVLIDRMHAEGNAGNQIKSAGSTIISNSVVVSNCNFFTGKSFTHNVFFCRALGNAVALAYLAGSKMVLVNNTITGQGDVLVEAAPHPGATCNGSEQLFLRNNILVASKDLRDGDGGNSALYWTGDCPGLSWDGDYNVIFKTKHGLCPGAHDLCQDPKLTSIEIDAFDPLPTVDSPGLNNGLPVGDPIQPWDYRGFVRPFGGGVDRGALEFGSHAP